MLYSGKNIIDNKDRQPAGEFVGIDGERFYEIRNYDKMQPFFISLASDTDLWMYLSSTGGLTAGRQSPEYSLFPYYTDDKITDSAETTGPKTILRVKKSDEQTCLWEPFSNRQAGVYDIERRIAKSVMGNKLVFTEENKTLGCRFSYMWCNAAKHGWIRRASLENLSDSQLEIEVLDGLQNVLPYGLERKTQNEFSTLVDGYKKTELVDGTTLVLFRMEAILVDRAEPSEALRCNTVYTLGIENADFLLSSRQLDGFRMGDDVCREPESKGVRGAVLAHFSTILDAESTKTWYFVADVAKDIADVRNLMHFLKEKSAIREIETAIAESTDTLLKIVGQNDGIQHTADEHNDARHFANTLFNTMRGGFYLDNYNISADAFLKHVKLFNKHVAEKHESFLAELPEVVNYADLRHMVETQNDAQLTRLLLEYLPLTFGRRHGDPSRPWNLFNIRVQDKDGNPIVSYQGNWRDIFQNWEALSVSYPGYVNGIIAKFLNATTVDGYNPYKVTSEGIDWEVIEPENPWSNIGYWGDHQIIYLLKLLELSWQHDPDALRSLLGRRLFAFANVPYRFKSYEEIVKDPKNTIRFDSDLHKHINALIPEYGQDARLVLDKNGEVLLTTFEDKLFITLLAKLSNFVPDAGIWMNTLRPEWNDANNALVGYGASMVTLCYMRRYVAFLKKFLTGTIHLNLDTAKLLYDIEAQIRLHIVMQGKGYGLSRLKFTNAVGKAGEVYRTEAYKGIATETFEFEPQDYQSMLDDMLYMIDESIRNNKREDGLYNAYNLIQFKHVDARRWEEDETIEVSHLYPMLEGQVAVLSSGLLTAEEAADLLDSMRQSDLYRDDQRSYMLYPDRKRKTFLELNNLPEDAKNLPVVQKYLGTILKEDSEGGIHFDASFRNANNLPEDLKDLYEQVFNHHAFTGRSGTFYKYEGLGCIYWHMVSKLLLAVGEVIAKSDSLSCGEGRGEVLRLKQHYLSIREGIGSHKQPQEYGSFPFDPYSHTPSMAGVQQPGMTGQVKEDILNRFIELGVSVENGQISFCPQTLTDADFKDGELRFTYCNTPVIYRKGEEKGITVQTEDKTISFNQSPLTYNLSSHIFARDGFVKQIAVTI